MKRQILLILVVTIFPLLLGVSTAISEESNSDQLTKFYENFIMEKIAQCYSKAELLKSSFSNIQNWAEVEFSKKAFFSKNKDILIKELIKNDIGIK